MTKYNEMHVRSNTAGNTHNVGTEEFRNQRAKDFANQKIKSAKDFNFDQYNDNNKGHRGTHISLAEINHLRKNNRNEDGGGRFQENYDVLKAQEDAGAVFGVKAEAAWNEMKERKSRMDSRQDAKDRASSFQANTDIKNTQEQNVTQDNDQESTVTGNDNYVYQNQDNSIRNYGGDNRSFVYNSNGGEGPDTPATMATLAGFYAPDDSHGAQAARFDRNVTMNRDAQKKYSNTSHIAMGAVKRAEQNSYIDPKKLDERIAARSQYHKDQATIKGAGIFGDIYGMEGPTWNSAKPAEEVEQPDFKKLADTYTDF